MANQMLEYRTLDISTKRDEGRMSFDVSGVSRIKEEGSKHCRITWHGSVYLLDASYDDVCDAVYKARHADPEPEEVTEPQEETAPEPEERGTS